MLLVRDVEPFERWSWHVLQPKFDAEVRLRAVADDRTEVTVATDGPDPRLAVARLHALLQTASTM